MTDLRLISPRAAAQMLGVSRQTLRRLTLAGAVPFVDDPESGRVRYQAAALRAAAERAGALVAERVAQ